MERSRRVEKRHTPHHFGGGGGGEKRGVKTLEERGRDEKERGTFKFSLYVFAVACLHSLDRVCERAFVSFLLTLTIVVASTPRIVVWGGEGKIKIERVSRPRVVKLLVLKRKRKNICAGVVTLRDGSLSQSQVARSLVMSTNPDACHATRWWHLLGAALSARSL